MPKLTRIFLWGSFLFCVALGAALVGLFNDLAYALVIQVLLLGFAIILLWFVLPISWRRVIQWGGMNIPQAEREPDGKLLHEAGMQEEVLSADGARVWLDEFLQAQQTSAGQPLSKSPDQL